MSKPKPSKALRRSKPNSPLPSVPKTSVKAPLVSPRLLRLLVVVGIASALVAFGLAANRRYLQNREKTLAAQCQHAKDQQDWPLLESLAREWATLQPSRTEPWLYAADAAREMHSPREEANYLSHIGDDAPVTAFYDLGRLQMEELNEPLAAVATCLRTLELHPRDAESHVRLLFFYSMTCQHEAVIAEARRAIAAGGDILPTYAHLVSARWLTYSNGFVMNSHWLESDPTNEMFAVAAVAHLISSRELNDMAQQSAAADDQPVLAMEYYETKIREGVEKYPNNIELQAVSIARMCQAGDVIGVAKALAAAPEESARDHRFWRFKGFYHAAGEQWNEAIAAYRRALELDPFDWSSQHELATALRRSDQMAEAAEVQARATLGKQIMRAIVLAPRIDTLPEGTMSRIAEYMESCGDSTTAEALRDRLASATP